MVALQREHQNQRIRRRTRRSPRLIVLSDSLGVAVVEPYESFGVELDVSCETRRAVVDDQLSARLISLRQRLHD